jgi:DNA polymerase III delta prime subunit
MFTYLQDIQKNFRHYYDIFPLEMLDATAGLCIDECSHVLFYGPDGSFKGEYLLEFIRRLYDIEELPERHTTTVTINTGNTKVDVRYNHCDYFLEFFPSEVSAYDKLVMSDVIKPIVRQPHVIMGRNIIIIRQTDAMTTAALLCLRRMMEVYHKNALFVMIAQQLGGIPDAIRSRCLLVRCPLPETHMVQSVYQRIRERFPCMKAIHETELQTLLQVAGRDVIRFCIYLTACEMNGSAIDLGTDMESHTRRFIDTLKKTKTPWTASPKIREFCYTMLHYGVHIPHQLQMIARLLAEKYSKKKEMVIFINIIATADHQLATALRPQIVFEHMWMNIFSVMCHK